VETALKTRAADRKKNRLNFLVPYLPTPTLAGQSFTLLALLHPRVNSRPEDWARFDNDEFASTWACDDIDVTCNPYCVVLFGPDYGRLRYRDAEKAHRADMIGFPRGQLLIEAQATLMGLLKRIMEKAIERMGPGLPEGTTTLGELVRATRTSSHTSTAWASYLHQATSDPPNLDLPAIVSEVRARLSDIGDHLSLMQTEPVYLRRHLRVMGQTSAADTNRSTDWGTEILVCEVKAILDRYWFWQGVLAELEHAYVIYGQFQGGISPGLLLPKKFDMTLGALEALLLQDIDLRSRQLYALIMERSAFSNMYEHVHEEETKSTIKKFRKGPGMPTEAGAYKTHRLWRCRQNLLGEYDVAARLSIPMLLSMLDDYLNSASAQERRKMDEVLYERFSDYETTMKITQSLRFHRPSYTKRQVSDCLQTEDRRGWRRQRLEERFPDDSPTVFSRLRAFQRTSPPAGGKNMNWLKAFDADHAVLRGFWTSLHSVYSQWHKRCQLSTEDTKTAMVALEFWTNEDYKQRLNVKREAVLSEITRRTRTTDDSLFLPLLSKTVPSSELQNTIRKSRQRREVNLDPLTEQ
jgi:hypothetical protein